MPSQPEVRDLLGNIGKASIVWLGAFIPAIASGGSGLPLLMTLMPAVVYLGAAYNVPVRETLRPSEKRKVPQSEQRQYPPP